MVRTIVLAGVLLSIACGRRSSKPAGTATDPVSICERIADVCRIDRSRLGVCTPRTSGSGLACASQH